MEGLLGEVEDAPPAGTEPVGGEPALTEADFRRVRDLIKARAGIDLGLQKRALVLGRLLRRVRACGLASFAPYLDLVETPGSDEGQLFVNALTTNVTSFFRESHHFDLLAGTLLPQLWRRNARAARLRLWSAGCASGEEPYSLAMVLRECPPPPGPWDLKVLATDIDSHALAQAARGIYAEETLAGVDPTRRRRWFLRGTGAHAGQARVHDEVRRLVTFRHLNLMDAWPMKGPFDVIFCRNVIIYFDEPTRVRLMKRFRALLAEGGVLVLGHSESLIGANLGFAPCAKTAYHKTADEEAP